ncbi:hypothetical protein CH275_08120 [Rhodococcus sp. 06-235-1A]|nr:hypothetical protein CH275_08120 [Rhodococcus sp. 06-235-1A]
MIASFPGLLDQVGPLNPVAIASELSAEQLVSWIMERTEFSFRDSVVGHEGGFLFLEVEGASFLFGAYGYPNRVGSFAMFLLVQPGDSPARGIARVQRLIKGGGILMDLANVAADGIPAEVKAIVSGGAGLPLSA